MPQTMLMSTDTVLEETTTFTCSECRKECDSNELTDFDGVTLCNDCYEERTVVCESCNNRIWYDDSCRDDDFYLCRSCFDRYYRRCYNCESIIHNDNVYYYNDEPYCSGCYHELDTDDNDENAIHSYNYKPYPLFYGDGIHYGVELEVDDAGESNSNAWAALDVGNYDNEHIYIKHDGSLNEGFEIVSHHMSLHYHQYSMNWRGVMEKLKGLGYLSHKSGTCGFHIHIEKAKLGDTFERQEETISNILYFVEKHWHELLKFSRRTPDQIQRWASRYGYKDSPKEILYHAKSGSWGRYVCVNLQNSETIELRMFRGTLKYSTFIATLQLTEEICNVAISLHEEALKALTWTEFVGNIDKSNKSELVEYLKYKNLYVNEPVDGEDDE